MNITSPSSAIQFGWTSFSGSSIEKTEDEQARKLIKDVLEKSNDEEIKALIEIAYIENPEQVKTALKLSINENFNRHVGLFLFDKAQFFSHQLNQAIKTVDNIRK